MENQKIHLSSSWQLPPTPKQRRAIARLAQQLGIMEPIEDTPSNRWEARLLIYQLNQRRKLTVHKLDQPSDIGE